MTTLIAGCGYLGKRVAQQLTDCVGLVASDASALALSDLNINAITHNLDSDQTPNCLHYDQVYYFVPPPPKGQIDTRIKHFLQALSPSTEKILLLSTTGVYGQANGEWIDETTPVKPQADRAKRRYDAEQQLTSWCQQHQVGYTIVRVPGIYGPHKLPLERLKSLAPIVREQDSGYTNRIHADDLANMFVFLMEHTTEHQLFNACDGNPSTMWDYFTQLADTFSLERPPELTMEEAEKQLSAGMMSYMRESRKIRNARILATQFTFQYPALSLGLEQCKAQMSQE